VTMKPPRGGDSHAARFRKRAPSRRSSTRWPYSRAFSSGSMMRNRAEGWIVTVTHSPSSVVRISPRSFEIVTARPSRLRAAVAPSATTSFGLMRRRSVSCHHLQRSISYWFGRLWMRRLPRCSNLKCLTAFVTKVSSRSMPAASSARSRSWPAGPTKGASRQILVITGLFTDEHQACLSWTFAGDNLGCVFVERAARATGLGCVQGLQRRDGGFRLFHATVTSGSTLRFVAARVGSQRNEVAHDPQA
jgi:hypothetical protein